MPQQIEKDLLDIEASLYKVETEYGKVARNAARKRFDLEIARAEKTDEITHRVLAEGEKKPTIPAIEAEVGLATKDELDAVRDAEAELDILKIVLSSLQSRLSSVQTRSKMMQMEMSLAR